MRVAYADPPYPGQAKRHYGHHPDYAGEVDHANLIRSLVDFDVWALSTSSTALQDVLGFCPPGVRVAAWVKPFAAFKNQRVTFAWEPVIYRGRPGVAERRPGGFLRDWVIAMPPIFNGESVTGVAGTKPREFCFWLFDLLGASPGDELHDLFPGSGAVSEHWDAWSRQMTIYDLGATEAEPNQLADTLRAIAEHGPDYPAAKVARAALDRHTKRDVA